MIVVGGEAVVDLVPAGPARTWRALPGGSPANTAVALARLGVPAAFLGRLSTDRFGRDLREHLSAAGVGLDLVVAAPEPSTLAVVSLDEHKVASYGFYLERTSDFAWTADERPALPPACTAVHVGSFATVLEPTASVLGAAQDTAPDEVVRSYDPNVRPGLGLGPEETAARVERRVRRSDLVRASEDDFAWLYPGVAPLDAARRWCAAGPAVVVVTHGPGGASAVTAHGEVRVPGRPVDVVDTVGAGDAFTAGLLAALSERGHLTRTGLPAVDAGELEACLGFAVTVSAVTCAREGADPPWRTDLPPGRPATGRGST